MPAFTLDDLPPNMRNQALAQIAKKPEPVKHDEPSETVKTAFSIAPMTVEDDLNKTEAAYLDELQSSDKYAAIHTQGITFLLGANCRYTPDFFTVDKEGKAVAWEVKGFWRDDARVKIKVAARMYRWVKFIAVQKEKGDWVYEEIKP